MYFPRIFKRNIFEGLRTFETKLNQKSKTISEEVEPLLPPPPHSKENKNIIKQSIIKVRHFYNF